MRCLSTSGAKPRDISTVARFPIEYNTSLFTNLLSLVRSFDNAFVESINTSTSSERKKHHTYIYNIVFKEIWRWNKLHTSKLTKMCYITFEYKIIEGYDRMVKYREVKKDTSVPSQKKIISWSTFKLIKRKGTDYSYIRCILTNWKYRNTF